MNKTYFNYLLKSKKNMIFFVVVFEILICMITRFTGDAQHMFYNGILYPYVYSMALCFLLPAYLLRVFHIRQMEDMYLSLPYSRKEQMASIFVFMLGAILIPLLVLSMIVGAVYSVSFAKIGLILLAEVIAISAILLFNANTYLTANSVLDGIVMMVAYSVLPAVITLFVSSFESVFVAGFNPMTEYTGWASILYQATVLMVDVVEGARETILAEPQWIMLVLVIISAVLATLLFRNIEHRKAERAMEKSSEFLAYPLIIHIYAFLCLGIVVFSAMDTGFDLYIFLFIVMIFIAYCVAHFVYRREIKIDFKSLAFFAVSILVAYGLGTAAFATRGFGLADTYKKDFRNVRLSWSVSSEEFVKQSIHDANIDIEGLEDENITYAWVSAEPVFNEATLVKHPEIKQFITNLQNEAVDAYYQQKNIDSNFYGNTTIYENYQEEEENYYWTSKNIYYYASKVVLDQDTLCMLAEFGEVRMTFETDGYDYYCYYLVDGKWVAEEEVTEEYGMY